MRSALTRRHVLMGTAALALVPRVGRAAGEKILLIGDSMIATAFGQRLEYGLDKAGLAVHRRGKSSSGLARPDFFDWLKEAEKLTRAQRPTSTIVMMGGNDTQGLKLTNGWINWGEPGWRGEYVTRVSDLLDIVSSDGEPVCWIGLPIVRSPSYRKKVEYVNELVSDTVNAHRGGRFVSTWNVLTKDGKYAAAMKLDGQQQDVRGSDGVHLTVAGARLLERRVRTKVVESVTTASS